ncbi:MAG TPA: TlpA disulfide reductase family protein [Treponemataceae bacterium]|nr:TlpA disulfide reductase family protein [Treponemataceae bacterium]
MEIPMKIKMFSAFSLLVLTLAACTPSKAKAEDQAVTTPVEPVSAELAVSGDPATVLAGLGFYVFPEPIRLPEFNAPGLAGGMIESTEFAGKVTLLNFWATWCPPCRKEMPSIERLHAAMNGFDFSIVAISVSEKKNTVEEFIASAGYTFPIYLDERGSIGSALASQGIPTTYILDKNGLVIAGIVGSFEYDNETLVNVFREMAK